MPKLRRILRGSLVLTLTLSCADNGGCGPAETAPAARPVLEIPADSIAARIWPSDGPTKYVPFETDRRATMRTLIRVAMDETKGISRRDYMEDLARRAGFFVEYWRVEGHEYFALLEDKRHNTGAGAYLFRIGPRGDHDRELILEAPHSYFDLGSGRLAVSLFFSGGDRVRALFVNTLHRWTQTDGAREFREQNPADVTDNRQHLFTVATLAAAAEVDEPEILQVHGFDNTSVPGSPDAIISAGQPDSSSPRSTALSKRLRDQLGLNAARFPEDTKSLGATTNVQNLGLRDVFASSFIHAELSLPLRKSKADNPELYAKLVDALLGYPAGGEAPQGGAAQAP